MSYPVIFYDSAGFTDMNWPTKYGTYLTMSQAGIPDDAVSSIKIAPFTRVVLYTDTNLRGMKLTLDGPAIIPDLSKITDSGGNWDDRTSSFSVSAVPPTPAQISSCCLGTGTGVLNCGPYVAGSAVCAEALRGYCTGKDSTGATVGPSNMGVPACQSWCRANPAICDKAAGDYCATTGMGTPFCTCLNSPAATRGLINPKCVDRACIDTGYLSTNMQQANCPNVINCTIQANLANSGVEIAKSVSIEQNCGNGNGSGTIVNGSVNGVDSGTANTGGVSTTTGTSTTLLSSGAILGLILFVGLLAVILIFGYIAYGESSAKPRASLAARPNRG